MSSFLIPIIAWLPKAYDCRIVMPLDAIAARTKPSGGIVERYWQVVVGGEVVDGGSDMIEFRGKRLKSPALGDVTWSGRERADWPVAGGYAEFGFRSVDDEDVFQVRSMPGLYNVYSAPGRKSFFSCHTWKFGSPQVISQIAEFGRYVDAYTACHIDRERGFTDSFVLINPYKRPILASLLTSDAHELPRIRIEPQSVGVVGVEDIVGDDVQHWSGQIQLTANNRLATHIVKHSIGSLEAITTLEHLDPFRADPTHMPWARWLRSRMGQWRADRGAFKRSTET